MILGRTCDLQIKSVFLILDSMFPVCRHNCCLHKFRTSCSRGSRAENSASLQVSQPVLTFLFKQFISFASKKIFSFVWPVHISTPRSFVTCQHTTWQIPLFRLPILSKVLFWPVRQLPTKKKGSKWNLGLCKDLIKCSSIIWNLKLFSDSCSVCCTPSVSLFAL